MLLQYQVECINCDSYQDIWTIALKMTRALANQPYRNMVTELECIRKLKCRVPLPENNDNNNNNNQLLLLHAQDVWVRQLQQIPGISEQTARMLARHYPTIQSLYRAYHQYSDDEDHQQQQQQNQMEELVAGCLHETRFLRMKSYSIYRLLTSMDPNELI